MSEFKRKAHTYHGFHHRSFAVLEIFILWKRITAD
uniref:Uncharacterized protein n=1 Tax=Manihot esculenta TaxID=3983 RepID=A0A199UC81_MANES